MFSPPFAYFHTASLPPCAGAAIPQPLAGTDQEMAAMEPDIPFGAPMVIFNLDQITARPLCTATLLLEPRKCWDTTTAESSD